MPKMRLALWTLIMNWKLWVCLVNLKKLIICVPILAPPKFGTNGTRNFQAIEGLSINIECPVEANPAPTIIWHRGETRLRSGANIQISPNAMVSLLYITLQLDFKIYKFIYCFQSNQLINTQTF
jgi:hypothetical protein